MKNRSEMVNILNAVKMQNSKHLKIWQNFSWWVFPQKRWTISYYLNDNNSIKFLNGYFWRFEFFIRFIGVSTSTTSLFKMPLSFLPSCLSISNRDPLLSNAIANLDKKTQISFAKLTYESIGLFNTKI